MTEDQDRPLGPSAAVVFGLTLLLGGIGHLCDIQSPLVRPLLPVFGLFFLAAFIMLLLICLQRLFAGKATNWVSGLMIGLYPVVFAAALSLAYYVFRYLGWIG